MKNKDILVFEEMNKKGAGTKVYVLSKKNIKKGDDISLEWISDNEVKKKEDWHFLRMKDWEALDIIDGLVMALRYKSYLKLTNKREKWKKKIKKMV